jgi:hypothetical protein
MSCWSARLTHTTTGLAIVFAGPVSRLDMSADVAQHLASLLAVEARHRLQGVVTALAFPNAREVNEDANLAPVEPGNPNAMHPLCCDCDHCLNGGPR